MYIDWCIVYTPENKFLNFRLEKKKLLVLFEIIFDSGAIMLERFLNKYNSNLYQFENHLCEIDKAKWIKFKEKKTAIS